MVSWKVDLLHTDNYVKVQPAKESWCSHVFIFVNNNISGMLVCRHNLHNCDPASMCKYSLGFYMNTSYYLSFERQVTMEIAV